MKDKVLAFHSSRGGTGKTTLAANLALAYAFEGLNVVFLDLDFRAPSLFSVFSKGVRRPVKKWLNDFSKYVKKEGSYVVIGNKMDLDNQRAVNPELGEKLAKELKASAFVETSARFNENVEIAFKKLINQILRNYGEDI